MFNSKLTGSIVSVSDLTSPDIDRMFNIMNENYDSLKRETFDKDLSEKSETILLKDNEKKQIRGFSTLVVLEELVRGKKTKALFSGDTIIEKEYWGNTELESCWTKYAFSLIEKNSETPLFWFLMSKGYKTYRFLPVFFYEFYPRYDKPTPSYEQEVLDTFAKSKFPLDYNPQTSLIIFDGLKDRLKKGVADIDESRLKNPHINYFVKKNPNWARGDELACIVSLTKENFNSMGKRMLTKARIN